MKDRARNWRKAYKTKFVDIYGEEQDRRWPYIPINLFSEEGTEILLFPTFNNALEWAHENCSRFLNPGPGKFSIIDCQDERVPEGFHAVQQVHRDYSQDPLKNAAPDSYQYITRFVSVAKGLNPSTGKTS